MITFADRVNRFNLDLELSGDLPDGIRVMNPFRENSGILQITSRFYKKFYDDHHRRRLILGINPGRLGAGATGIPFTDSKRLTEKCGIPIPSVTTHEPSSVFVYDLIEQYGGVNSFYRDFFITSLCPLGFLTLSPKGNWVNCNYYDRGDLFDAVRPFIVRTLRQQIAFGVDTTTCYVLGKKNARYVDLINKEEKLFGSLVALDHPRYIEQYRSGIRDQYISAYLKLFSGDGS
jgi:hypothetical protein